jgi:hypothetical protein
VKQKDEMIAMRPQVPFEPGANKRLRTVVATTGGPDARLAVEKPAAPAPHMGLEPPAGMDRLVFPELGAVHLGGKRPASRQGDRERGDPKPRSARSDFPTSVLLPFAVP